MKKLIAAGVTLITTRNFNLRRGGAHDPWGSHAPYVPIFNIFSTASGKFVNVFEVYLSDGIPYYYTINNPTSYANCLLQYDGISKFKSPDGLVGFVGLWWNYTTRGFNGFKGTYSEFAAWLATQ